MTMIYSNPGPDVEVWEHHHTVMGGCRPSVAVFNSEGVCRGAGWYWQSTSAGVFADAGPGANGPFDTEQEAIDDAQAAAITVDDIADAAAEYIGTAFGGPQGNELLSLCVRCAQPHVCYACNAVHNGPEDDNPNCNPDDSGNEECSLRAVELPQCVLAMGCYCAGHARGNPAGMACDTSEQAGEVRQ